MIISKKIPYEEKHRETNGLLEKKCSICNEWFPCTLEYFYKNKSNKRDGLNTWCIKCSRNKASINRNNNIEKYRKVSREWNRGHKEAMFAINKRYRSKRLLEKQIYQSEYFKNNPDKIKEYREKRQNKNHRISTKEWESCKKYFNHRCAYCGLAIEEHYITYKGITKLGDFHKEHVVHDGVNDLSNCVPSCGSCNYQKWEFTLDEWYNKNNIYISGYTQERYNKIIKWLTEDWKIYYIKKKLKSKDKNEEMKIVQDLMNSKE